MKNYEVTLMATAYKTLRICADNEHIAEALAMRMYRDADVICYTPNEIDELAVQATELEEPAIQMPSARELLYQNLLYFCMNQTNEFDEAEIRNMLDELETDKGFDPLLYWKFVPICSFETSGSDELSYIYRHNRLFGKNGHLLDSSLGKGTSAMSTVTENYELWLLEDMSLVVTFCCRMEVSDDDGDHYEVAAYRYPVSGSYAELAGDFHVGNLLEEVYHQVCEARNMA